MNRPNVCNAHEEFLWFNTMQGFPRGFDKFLLRILEVSCFFVRILVSMKRSLLLFWKNFSGHLFSDQKSGEVDVN